MTAQKTDKEAEIVRSIDDNTKRYFDAVESLRQAAWQSFDRRRSFEWKLSFGFWTALGSIIVGLAIGEATLKSTPERVFLSLVSLVVVLLHGWWSFFLDQVNRADLDKSYAYEQEQMLALGITGDTKTAVKVRKIVAAMTERAWVAKHWGHITQVAVTGIMAAAVTVITWLR
jgi:hypothetical protein